MHVRAVCQHLQTVSEVRIWNFIEHQQLRAAYGSISGITSCASLSFTSYSKEARQPQGVVNWDGGLGRITQKNWQRHLLVRA
jgi:hypothetical protein